MLTKIFAGLHWQTGYDILQKGCLEMDCVADSIVDAPMSTAVEITKTRLRIGETSIVLTLPRSIVTIRDFIDWMNLRFDEMSIVGAVVTHVELINSTLHVIL